MLPKSYKFIPVNEPVVTSSDAKSVYKTVKSGWISSTGNEINKFEKKFAKIINKKYATTVSNGTAALEIALKALCIGKNDEVIIPNFTIISTALAVIKLNATPVLVDCDHFNWNMNIDQIKKKLQKKLKQ